MKTFYLTEHDAGLRYHALPGDGPPLLFLHGIGCASSCDYSQVSHDSGLAGRPKLLIDLLGSGFSDRPSAFSYTIDDHARCIVALADHLSLSAFDLFGHSMGGTVAIAATDLLKSRVRHLVLGEPNLDAGGGFFSRKIAEISEEDYVVRGHDELIATSRSEGNDLWAASLTISSASAVHCEAQSLVSGGNPAWRDLLYGLPISKTVLFGAQSLPDPDFEELPRHGVKVDIVPSAGHSMAWDNPTGLAAALQRALA